MFVPPEKPEFENYVTTFSDTIDKIVLLKIDVVRDCTKSSGQNPTIYKEVETRLCAREIIAYKSM